MNHSLPTALALTLLATVASTCFGETFRFGNSQNGINGQATATLNSGAFTLQLQPSNPLSGRLNEPDANGLGIDSSAVTGVFDSKPNVLNTIHGAGTAGSSAESLTFSFDRAGILTGINFDGVKDEALEFFVLETAGSRINFFDSAANISVVGAVDAAAAAGAIHGSVSYLLEINDAIDDEAQGLRIPFAAGQQFTLTYAELPAGFGPTEPGNGARLQGITVVSVPEPSACLLAINGIVALVAASRARHAH